MSVHTIKQHTMRMVTLCTLTILVLPSFMLFPLSARGVVLRGLIDPQELFEAGRQPAAQGQVSAAYEVAGERDGITVVAGLLVLITLAAGAYRFSHRHYPTKQPDTSIEQDEVQDAAHGGAAQAHMPLMPSAKGNLLR